MSRSVRAETRSRAKDEKKNISSMFSDSCSVRKWYENPPLLDFFY